MSVRCKFRCMSVTRHVDSGTIIEFLPVLAKGKHTPEGSEENSRFWDATPSGDVKLTYKPGLDGTRFEVGGYYYIDLLEAGSSQSWKLWELSQRENSLVVRLGLGWSYERILTHAELMLDIHNQGAWAPFQGKVGTHWTVTFTPCK